MKKILAASVVIFSFNTFASDSSFVEVGLGTEYGGLGTQIYLPLKSDVFDFYISAGLFSYSTETNGELGAGLGSNFYISKKHSIGIYAGVLGTEKVTDYENFQYDTESQIGGSINYKYRFSGKGKSGWVIGASYNIHSDDSYPFVSIGYRF